MAKIDDLLRRLVEAKASDLHLTSGMTPMWRLHGEMQKVEDRVISPEVLQVMFEEIAPEKNIKQFEESWDTDFAYEIEGVARFRANLFMDRYGPGGVFRVIPSKIITAEELNLPKAIIEMCQLTKGLVVVTGPTGSGKSTTLSAMIDYINRTRSDHIITIEDPVEFVHNNKKCLINQREVNSHTKSFKAALRAALREDPDIVLIGELRDLETVEIAIETAETGHLVFGTLHTNTAPSTVERIIQQFPGDKQNQIRQMLANSLKGVVAQNLLKKKDGKGRVAAMEILVVNSAVSSQIREGKTFQIQSSMQVGAREGMVLLNDTLFKMVEQDIVTKEEALAKAVDKAELNTRFEMGKIGGPSTPPKMNMMDDDEDFVPSFKKKFL